MVSFRTTALCASLMLLVVGRIAAGQSETLDGLKGMSSKPLWAGMSPDKFQVSFKARQLAVSPGDHHFGVTLKRADGKGLMLFTRGGGMIRLKEVGVEDEIGRFREPLRAGADAPWALFSIAVNAGFVELNVDHALVGSFNADFMPVTEIVAYAYNVNVEFADFKFEIPATAKTSATARQSLEVGFDGSADALADGKEKVGPLKAEGIEFTDGVAGKAVHVGGKAGQKLQYDVSAVLGGEAGSVSFWFRPDWDGSADQVSHFLLRGLDAQGKPCFSLWSWGTGPLRADIPRKGMNGIDVWRFIRAEFLPGDWLHFALTWDADGWVKLYVDGLPYRSGDIFKDKEDIKRYTNLDMASVKTLCVGDVDNSRANAFGAFDGLKVFSRALSGAEVAAERRAAMPLDLLLDRDSFHSGKDETLELRVAPEGFYSRPQIGTPLDRASATLDVEVAPDSGPAFKTQRFKLGLNGPRTLPIALGKLQEGKYKLRCLVSQGGAKVQKTFPFKSFVEPKTMPPSDEDLKADKAVFEIDFAKDSCDSVLHDGSLQLQSSGIGKYLETSGSNGSRLAFPIPFPERLKGKPVVLEITWPDDKPRSMGFYMYPKVSSQQHRDRLSGGIQTGIEYPNTGAMQITRHIFYPGVDSYLFEARTMIKDYPAAVAKIRVLELDGARLPKLSVKRPEGFPPRTLGHTDEDQTPDIHLNFDDPARNVANVTEKWCDYFDYTGQDVVSYPVMRYDYIRYPLNSFRGGCFPSGRCGLGTFVDMLGERDMRFLATLNIYTLPDLSLLPDRQDEFPAKGYFVIAADGKPAKSGHIGYPKPNFNNPEVKEMLFWHLRQLAGRYGSMPGFVGFDIWPGVFTLPLDEDYGDATLAAFSRDCQVSIPANADTKTRHEFLASPALRGKWLKWRADRTTALFREIVACVKDVNPKLQVNLQLGIPKGDETTEGLDTKAALLDQAFDLDALMAIPGLDVYPSHQANTARWQLFWGGPESTIDEAIYDFALFAPFGNTKAFHVFPAYYETFKEPLLPKIYQSYFQNADVKPAGRHFLKQLVYPLAMTDAQRILIGAQPIGTLGRDSETREFAKAYRALPALPFDDVDGMRDPVTARSLSTKNGTYLYLANLIWSGCDVTMSPAVPLEDLSTGETLKPGPDGALAIELKPYQLRSFLAKGEVKFVKLTVTVPEATKAYYAAKVEALEAALTAVAAAGEDVAKAKERLDKIKALLAAGSYADAHRLIFSKRMNALRKLKVVADLGQLKRKSEMLAASTYAVKCGQDAFLATKDGALYLPDQAFDGVYGHDGSYQCVTRNIDKIAPGVERPELYVTEAYDLETYRFKVKPGVYTVKIRFKIGYEPNGKAGVNVINLDLEGKRVLDQFDLFKANGSDFNKVLVKEFKGVKMEDGVLDVAFSIPEGGHPTVRFCNAIEIAPEN